MFHIHRYRVIKCVSYDFACNTFRRGLDHQQYGDVASIMKRKEESIMEEGS